MKFANENKCNDLSDFILNQSEIEPAKPINLTGIWQDKGFEKISSKVPLAEMNKYSTTLSSLTNGRAMYSMKFLEYAQVPPDVQEKLLKAYQEEEEEV